jgi:hypothetical protein
MPTMNIPDFAGVSTAVEKPNANGRVAAGSSRPVALSNEDKAVLDNMVAGLGAIGDAAWASGNGTLVAILKTIANGVLSTAPSPVQARNPDYETVAASATDQVMGASGAAGDYISHVIIIPATTSPGAVSIKDGSGSAITIFTGGASSVTSLVPFAVPLGLIAGTAWKITTGAAVSAIGVGDFT